MLYARIQDNMVWELFRTPRDLTPFDYFHPFFAVMFNPAPEGTEPNSMVIDGVLVPPDVLVVGYTISEGVDGDPTAPPNPTPPGWPLYPNWVA